MIVGVAVQVGCSQRRGDVVEIPDGYIGWVEIKYSADCPPAPELADGRLLLRINRDGRLCVGSRWEEGYAVDEFFYVRPTGRRRVLSEETPTTGMIWARSSGHYNLGKVVTERFFVGTEKQFHAQSQDGKG
jgi:hypothetical protein